jgi:hypothetical protein
LWLAASFGAIRCSSFNSWKRFGFETGAFFGQTGRTSLRLKIVMKISLPVYGLWYEKHFPDAQTYRSGSR